MPQFERRPLAVAIALVFSTPDLGRRAVRPVVVAQLKARTDAA